MLQPKEYSNSLKMEQGVEIAVIAKEHIAYDHTKSFGDPEHKYIDGTYEVTVDLSESDEKKLNHGLIIMLPCGGKFEFGLDGGWFSFKDEYSDDGFYMEYNKCKNR